MNTTAPLERIAADRAEKCAVIGRERRDLLPKRGVTAGRIECTVKIPGKAEKKFSLALEFEP